MHRILLAFILGVVGALGVSTQTAHALSSDPKHFVGADNTFYAYVKAGEKIGAEFVRSPYTQEGHSADITVSIEGPGVERKNCVLKRDFAIGSGCVFKPIIATKSGIWRIVMAPGKNAKPFPELSSEVRWVRNLYSWKIEVTDSKNVEQKGRIWTDRYAFRQPSDNSRQFTGDFTTYYVSENGYIYKTVNKEYNGQASILLADAVGVRSGDSCTSAYQSAEVGNENLSPALGACGMMYKLFFEEPTGNLPEEAERWDGEKDWVRPSIKQPTISELHFTPDGSSDQLSGAISFYLRNFIGQYEIKIDVDNDGDFDGQNDVTLYERMEHLSNGLQRIHFQGVDKKGQIIFPNQTIGIKVNITKVAEIHFVAVDVEGRGGIEVTRLNGANAPTTRLCWNDTELTSLAPSFEAFSTSQTDGRSCPDSANGVHGWAYHISSWGNARYIDDWTYASANLSGNNQIKYPENETKVIEEKDQNLGAIIGAVAGGIILIGVVFATISIKRRSKRQTVPPPEQPTQYPSQHPSNQQTPPMPPQQYPQNPQYPPNDDPNRQQQN